MKRLAALLRRLAALLDPAGASPATVEAEPPNMVAVSREELRGIQHTAMTMLDDWLYLSRVDGRRDGLLWVPADVLASVAYVVGHELETRERDFAAIERDPTTRLR